jgi:hypothetical protein
MPNASSYTQLPHVGARPSPQAYAHYYESFGDMYAKQEARRQAVLDAIFNIDTEGLIERGQNSPSQRMYERVQRSRWQTLQVSRAQKAYNKYKQQVMAADAKGNAGQENSGFSPTAQYYLDLAYNRQIGVPSYFHQTFRRRYAGPQF